MATCHTTKRQKSKLGEMVIKWEGTRRTGRHVVVGYVIEELPGDSYRVKFDDESILKVNEELVTDMIQKAIEWRHNSQSDAMTGTPKPTGPRSKKVKSNIDTSGSEVEEESEEEGSNDDNDINHEEEWSPNTKASKKATPNSSTRKSPRKSRRSVIEPNTVPSKKSTPFSRNTTKHQRASTQRKNGRFVKAGKFTSTSNLKSARRTLSIDNADDDSDASSETSVYGPNKTRSKAPLRKKKRKAVEESSSNEDEEKEEESSNEEEENEKENEDKTSSPEPKKNEIPKSMLPKDRRRWSAEETKCLMDLIEEHNGPGAWRMLLEKGKGIFAPQRTNVDLKDRYRTIMRQRSRQAAAAASASASGASGSSATLSAPASASRTKRRKTVDEAGERPDRLRKLSSSPDHNPETKSTPAASPLEGGNYFIVEVKANKQFIISYNEIENFGELEARIAELINWQDKLKIVEKKGMSVLQNDDDINRAIDAASGPCHLYVLPNLTGSSDEESD